MLNKIILQGRFTAKPELRTTSDGIFVSPFTLAVKRNYGDGLTDFINCVAWRNNAEFIVSYFGKGDAIVIEGELNVRKYEDKDGNNRTAYEVKVDRQYFGGGKAKANEHGETDSATTQNSLNGFTEVIDDDLPF